MKNIYKSFGIDDKIFDFVQNCENESESKFKSIDNIAEINQAKVLLAMQKNNVSAACLNGTTGYGYNDLGRDTLEKVYADCFCTEAAIVRPQLICGTHALAVALFGNLRPGDEILSPVDMPYDTLQEVIGIRKATGSLAEYGVTYNQVDLLPDGSINLEGIKKAINNKTKLVTIQRSKGYSTRPTLSVDEIGSIISLVKSINSDIICMVDNCYGEFTEIEEPSQLGADMIVGSLIKNIGGGLCPCGGYICGTAKCIENAAARMSAPGLGAEVGASLGILSSFYEGLFLAPTVTASAVKGAILTAACFEKLGFDCFPKASETRHDIVQAVNLNSPDGMVAFCKGIQAAAPVDSFVAPEPSEMPGYDCDVIMAAGTFVQGSSIELSSDGPMREPFTIYFQGGLTYYHAKLGVLMAIKNMSDKNLINI